MNLYIYNVIFNYNVKIVGWENGSVCLERYNGTKRWYSDGRYHRVNGPAIEYADGDRFWYLNGKEYTEEEFNTTQSR